MPNLKDDFKCSVCHRNMRKPIHVHKMKGGTVRVFRPKGAKP